jgi:hypothetical protein
MATTNGAVGLMQGAVAQMAATLEAREEESRRDAGTQLRRLNRIALGMMRLRSLRPGLDEAEREAIVTAVVDAMESM